MEHYHKRPQTASFFLLAVLWAGTAQAKDLYVNGVTGNDAVTYAQNSATNPWRTIARAAWGSTSYAAQVPAEAAHAADTVWVAAGVYWEDGQVGQYPRFSVHMNPANNGTAQAPIVFRGVGRVEIRMNHGFRGGTIGASGRNYIIWDNFVIDDYYQGSTSDTGPVVFSSCDHCMIVNCDIKGHPGSYYHGYDTFTANYRGISLEPASFVTIRNNRIHHFSGGQNEAGIMAYDSNDNLIENNDIHDNGTGIFIKGIHAGKTQARNIIRRNVLYNNTYAGIRVLGSSDAKIYQNVIYGRPTDGEGLRAGWSTSERSLFVNNSVHGCNSGFLAQGDGLIAVRFWNNIISSPGQAAIVSSVANPTRQDVTYDRNLYHDFPRMWADNWGGGSFSSFAQFQAYGQDPNGMEGDPLFVDPTNHDFRLQAGSPARTLGRDILDLDGDGSTDNVIPAGAYITGDEVIGFSLEEASSAFFIRGDCNGDGGLDISDGIFNLAYLVLGGARPRCLEACNSDGGDALDISDSVYLFGYLFLGSRPPAVPFPECGEVALEAAPVGCEESTCEVK